MNKQIILFGAGLKGREALEFFGPEAVFCFVSNDPDSHGQKECGKTILSADELARLFKTEAGQNSYEIVISILNIWSVLTVANQLKKIGIYEYSTYTDVRRRWRSGADFLNRDRALVPCERESVLEIYGRQFDYLYRHTDATHLLPATGALREAQMEKIRESVKFLEQIEPLGIRPFMMGGTLIGALRHKGFIPWDDDIDFCIMYDDYQKLLAYCEDHMSVYRYDGYGAWVAQDGSTSWESASGHYIVTVAWGSMKLRLNLGSDPFLNGGNGGKICDIFPVYYIDERITREEYAEHLRRWDIRRRKDFDEVDRVYGEEIKKQNIFVNKSGLCARGFDCVSTMNYRYGKYGKHYNANMWKESTIFPLKKLPFEGYELWAPNDPMGWLEGQEIKTPMSLPKETGIRYHKKDLFLTEQY